MSRKQKDRGQALFSQQMRFLFVVHGLREKPTAGVIKVYSARGIHDRESAKHSLV